MLNIFEDRKAFGFRSRDKVLENHGLPVHPKPDRITFPSPSTQGQICGVVILVFDSVTSQDFNTTLTTFTCEVFIGIVGCLPSKWLVLSIDFYLGRKSPINSICPSRFPEVLLLSWNSQVGFDRGYSLVEVFSGKGCVSQKWHFICKLSETSQSSNCLTCQHVQHR